MSLAEKRWADVGLASASGVDEVAPKDVSAAVADFTAEKPAAIYQLPGGNWCLFVATPGTRGCGYYESPDRALVEAAATAMGVGERLGIEVASAEKL